MTVIDGHQLESRTALVRRLALIALNGDLINERSNGLEAAGVGRGAGEP